MSLDIPQDKLEELCEQFDSIDINGSGFLEVDEVQNALKVAGFNLPMYKVRDLIKEYDVNQVDGKIDFEEFKKLYADLKQKDFGFQVTKVVKTKEGVQDYGTRCDFANNDIKHTIRHEEQVAFADWINSNLIHDDLCKRYLPFKEDGSDMYTRCTDGIILCKVINSSAPDTIDVRALNVEENLSIFKKHENIVLALNSSRAIGCNVVNIRPSEIETGVPHLLLGLLWQIIKVGLLSEINLTSKGELACLLLPGETLEDLRKLTPVELLLRWVNYHLANAQSKRRVSNFNTDIRDSEVYSILIDQISPHERKEDMHKVNSILSENNHLERAELTLQNADKLDARSFVSPADIVSGNNKLNLAFVANLFNHYPGLYRTDVITHELEEIIEETREEKTFRNWMNSIGVNPRVNYIYSDLTNGLIIFQIYDIITPGIVNWKRVNQKFSKIKINFEILENCNYAIELGKTCNFSLVGIGGEDIKEGNKTLTLALIWQLMRAYTFAVLMKLNSEGKPIDDKAILEWANNKFTQTKRDHKLQSFQDGSLRTGEVILDLVDAVTPGSVKRDIVKRNSRNSEDWLDNAKYAITMSRKIGAMVYALPEDIIELKGKMIMTIIACLMTVDHNKSQTSK